MEPLLKVWTSDHGEIRVDPHGRPSIFDMLRVLGGQKSPHKVWQRLAEAHPEVLTKCQNLQFPGSGQRPTPVAKGKEDAYYILGLMPGAVGKKYRETTSRMFVRWLDAPELLVQELTDQLSEDAQKRQEARLASKRTRNQFTNALKAHGTTGWGFGAATDAVYSGLMGKTAKVLKAELAPSVGIPPAKVNPRDHMSIEELGEVEMAERISAAQLGRHQAQGNPAVVRVVSHTARTCRALLDGDLDVFAFNPPATQKGCQGAT